MIRAETLLPIPSSPYLYDRPPKPRDDADLHRLPEAIPHALQTYAWQLLAGRRRFGDVLRGLRSEGESILAHVWEGLEATQVMDRADRASNGLRRAIQRDVRDPGQPSEFGMTITRINEDPRYADHHREHVRRLERWFETMVLRIEQLRHTQSVADWLDSCFLALDWHDIDQLLTAQRNLELNEHLPTKKGHALAAAVMILALHERYAYERKVSIETAWKICAAAAIMIVKHDEPEHFSRALAGRQKAYWSDASGRRILLSGDALEEAFRRNTLDLFSLAPSQLIELLIREKGRYGFITKDIIYGLYPDFEREYRAFLEALATNHRPLIEDLQDPQDPLRQSFTIASEAFELSDTLDMVAPPVEAAIRTFLTPISQTRPFFRPGDLPAMVRDITDGEGNVAADQDSTARRIFWEMVHMHDHVDPTGPIGKSAYINAVMKDNALMGVIAFREIGVQLMAGDTTAFARTYAQRKAVLIEKALRRASVGFVDRTLLLAYFRKTGETKEVYEAIRRDGTPLDADRLEQKIAFLTQEEKRMEAMLLTKPEGKKAYSKEDIDQFSSLADAMIAELCQTYDVSKTQLRRYRSKNRRGAYPDTLPYRTYDSLGGTPRTLVKPLGT